MFVPTDSGSTDDNPVEASNGRLICGIMWFLVGLEMLFFFVLDYRSIRRTCVHRWQCLKSTKVDDVSRTQETEPERPASSISRRRLMLRRGDGKRSSIPDEENPEAGPSQARQGKKMD